MRGANSFARNTTGPTKKFGTSEGARFKSADQISRTTAKRAAQLLVDGRSAPSLLLVQVMNQINPTRWQRFVRNVIILRAQHFADALQYRFLPLQHRPLHSEPDFYCVGNVG